MQCCFFDAWQYIMYINTWIYMLVRLAGTCLYVHTQLANCKVKAWDILVPLFTYYFCSVMLRMVQSCSPTNFAWYDRYFASDQGQTYQKWNACFTVFNVVGQIHAFKTPTAIPIHFSCICRVDSWIYLVILPAGIRTCVLM